MLDAGGVIRHTQVGFEAGDEATYIRTLHEILDGSKKAEPAAGAAPAAWPAAPKAGHTGPAQKLLFYTSSGTTTPHDTVLPFVFAVKASEKGHRPVVFLAGDATLLAKDGVLDAVRAPGQPDAATLWKRAVELKIPIFL
ncbi:MAG TPA: hypothetical protein VF384_08300 [Planctomycetota bacterium]